ncbi:MAG TPA: RnfABCDGE type electron transport complex subunit B [Lachnospiraceae bacterium]|nr:RnfABCDGE type electron transport complex subunit B [Lachnospiraceae bacterium]
MDFISIIVAMLVVGSVGLFMGLFLGIAGIKFKVTIDEKEEAVLGVLPGYNCGGCGYAGCASLATAIAKNEAAPNACPVGGEPVSRLVGEIMGVEVEAGEKKVAFVQCAGTCTKTKEEYEYSGVEDCRMLNFVPNKGAKSCNYGCTGYGNCVKACMFDAIHVIDGIAVVDEDKCKACGKCIEACPRDLIEMIPYKAEYRVACKSNDKGPVTMKICEVGCIGCGLCKKACPADAITVEHFLAYIDQSKCISCGACKEVCPKKTIS